MEKDGCRMLVLTEEITRQQQLLAAVPAFLQFMTDHMNEYAESENSTISRWAKAIQGEMCRQGKYRVLLVEPNYSMDWHEFRIRVMVRAFRHWFGDTTGAPNVDEYNVNLYLHPRTALTDLCSYILEDILHVDNYIDSFEEYSKRTYRYPIYDFVNEYRLANKNLII